MSPRTAAEPLQNKDVVVSRTPFRVRWERRVAALAVLLPLLPAAVRWATGSLPPSSHGVFGLGHHHPLASGLANAALLLGLWLAVTGLVCLRVARDSEGRALPLRAGLWRLIMAGTLLCLLVLTAPDSNPGIWPNGSERMAPPCAEGRSIEC